MQQIHGGKQRILGEYLRIGRIPQTILLDDFAPVQLAPRLLPVLVGHPILIEIPVEPHIVQIDDLIVKVKIGPVYADFVLQTVIKEHLIRARALRRKDGIREQRGLDVVVRIHEGDVPAARNIKPGVARGGKAAVLLVDQPDARVPLRIRLHDGRAVVLRAVVDKNQLKVVVGLGKDAVKASGQIRFHLIDRYNHADHAHGATSSRFGESRIDYTINPMHSPPLFIKP